MNPQAEHPVDENGLPRDGDEYVLQGMRAINEILSGENKKVEDDNKMKIDWKRKLSSRKLWTAVMAWVTSILTAFNVSDSAIAQVSIVVAGIGALAVYMLAEAYADGKSAGGDIENGG